MHSVLAANSIGQGPIKDVAVLEEYRMLSKRFVGTSPDGTAILSWIKSAKGPENEGLLVQDAATGDNLYSMSSDEVPMRPTWRPDGKAIAYFRQDTSSNVRRLFIWDLVRGTHEPLSIPTSYAQAFVRWSPDGESLAFTNGDSGVVICRPQTKEVRFLRQHIVAFDWKIDSQTIAALVEEPGRPAYLVLFDASTGQRLRAIDTRADRVLRNLAWQPSKEILLCSSEPRDGGANALSILDPETDQERDFVVTNADLRDPVWLPHAGGAMWHSRGAGGSQSIQYRSLSDVNQTVVEKDGALNFRTFLPDGLHFVASRVGFAANELLVMRIGAEEPPKVLATMFSPVTEQVLQQNITLKTQSGQAFTMRIAKFLPHVKHRNGVFIRVHGQDLSATPQDWTDTQLYLRHGIQCIHVGNYPAIGSDAVVEAIRYSRDVLKVPPQNICVFGASSSAVVALEAALRVPSEVGLVSIIGLMASPKMSAPALTAPNNRFFLMAFHGERDRKVSPGDAQTILTDVLGPDGLHPPHGFWHVFPNEDHSLHLDESLATVHASNLTYLGAIDLGLVPNSKASNGNTRTEH